MSNRIITFTATIVDNNEDDYEKRVQNAENVKKLVTKCIRDRAAVQIEKTEIVESNESIQSNYDNNNNSYNNDHPETLDIDPPDIILYGYKNKDGIYYRQLYSSPQPGTGETKYTRKYSYDKYITMLKTLIKNSNVNEDNYEKYHPLNQTVNIVKNDNDLPEQKVFKGKNPDGILYENLYDNNKRHFDDFDGYNKYKSQLDLGKTHEIALSNVIKTKKEEEMKEKERIEKDRIEKERKEKEILITKDNYDEHVPKKQLFSQKKEKNIDGIPFENLYMNEYRIYDYKNYNDYRKEYFQKTSGGKRKSRRNRKSKKGKRSRKARKSRRKSKRRRGRR